MSRQPAKPTKAQATAMLETELDKLVTIDEQRNAHTSALTTLQSQRDVQVGRMQMVAEQAGVELEGWVTAALTARREAPR